MRRMLGAMLALLGAAVSALAEEAFDGLAIQPRSVWDAAPEDHRPGNLKPIGEVRHVSVHHTAVDKLRGDGTAEAELRIIQRGHQVDNQWGDIAYHFLIAPDGRVFAGRSTEYAVNSGTRYLTEAQWRNTPVWTPGRVAEHSGEAPLGGTTNLPESETGPRPGNVEGHVTICFLGNFMESAPTDDAKNAFVKLCAGLLKEYNLQLEDVWLHREVAASLCPGDALYHWLRAYPESPRYSLGEGLRHVEQRLNRIR